MVRDPSIVSPSLTGVFIGLTGVFIGGGHNKHGIQDRGARTTHHAAEGPQRVDRAVSSPLSIISLGDVGGDGGVTDRATRGTCSAGSGTGLVHYLTGPEITETAPVTVSGLRGVEPLRDGQAHQSSVPSGYLPTYLTYGKLKKKSPDG